MYHKSKPTIIATIAIIVLILSGCEQVVITTTPTPTVLPKLIQNADAPFTPVISLTSTNEPSIKLPLTEQCPTISPSENLSKIGAEGVVVLLGEFNRHSSGGKRAFLLDLSTQEKIEFSSEYGMLISNGIAVSPDYKTLAYTMTDFDNESVKFVIANNMGEHQKVIQFQRDDQDETGSVFLFGMIQRWLNNEQISLGRGGTILNPYTEDMQIYEPKDYPGILSNDFGSYVLQFDPRISRVVYSHSNGTTAITDLTKRQVLAEIPALYRSVEVAWSPDGKFAAITGKGETSDVIADELFIIDRDGNNVNQVTQLAQYYGVWHILSGPLWSPDGKRIAFWQAYDDGNISGNVWRLFVLNVETETLTSYCTWGIKSGVDNFGPIWSPDGKQLLLADFSIRDSVRTFMIDLEKNVAIPVGEDIESVIPVGWMVAP